MRVGAGNAVIAFQEELLPLEGFCGIHDLPKISVLVVEGTQKVVIVSVEIVMLWDDFLDKCRKAAAKATNTQEEHVWIHVTHAITTPHAPGGPLIGLGGDIVSGKNGRDGEDRERVLEKRALYEDTIYRALMEALKNADKMLEAKLYVGTGECDLIEGRDIETPDGWWIGVKGSGESNETMTILVFKDMQEHVIAALISYGMKPCVIDNAQMDVNKRLISADAPGLCCRELEMRFGVPVLYCTAAAGDRIPVKTAWYDKVGADGKIETVDLGVEKGIEFAKDIGLLMAQTAEKIMNGAKEMPVTAVSHRASSFLWDTKRRVPMHPYRDLTFTREGSAEVPVEVISLGDVALVGGKPEINTITEKQLQERSGFKYTLYLSMVGGGMKYMPDAASYDRLSWESLASMLMPGAAERFVEVAIRLLEGN